MLLLKRDVQLQANIERERERERLMKEVFGAAGRAAAGGVVVKLVVQHHNKAPVRTEY